MRFAQLFFWPTRVFGLGNGKTVQLIRAVRGALALIGVGGMAGMGWAETLVLSPAADTGIFSEDANNNFGKSTDLILGPIAHANQKGRLLVRFDLSVLPKGAKITNASLELTVSKRKTTGVTPTVRFHRLLKDWGEGTKTGQRGSAAGAGEATWNARKHGSELWGSPGGKAGSDFVEAASFQNPVDRPGLTRVPSSSGLVEDLQKWQADAGSNFGWILIFDAESVAQNPRRVVSREGANKPALVLSYTVEPVAPEVVPVSISRAGDQVELRFKGVSGNLFSVERRDSLVLGGWQSITNIPAKLQDVDARVLDPIGSKGAAFYRVIVAAQID